MLLKLRYEYFLGCLVLVGDVEYVTWEFLCSQAEREIFMPLCWDGPSFQPWLVYFSTTMFFLRLVVEVDWRCQVWLEAAGLYDGMWGNQLAPILEGPRLFSPQTSPTLEDSATYHSFHNQMWSWAIFVSAKGGSCGWTLIQSRKRKIPAPIQRKPLNFQPQP